MLSPPRWPAVTLKFDLQNLTRSSTGANGYPCKFLRVFWSRSRDRLAYRGKTIGPDERMNERTSAANKQPEQNNAFADIVEWQRQTRTHQQTR